MSWLPETVCREAMRGRSTAANRIARGKFRKVYVGIFGESASADTPERDERFDPNTYDTEQTGSPDRLLVSQAAS
jgi:hypothetical protein